MSTPLRHPIACLFTFLALLSFITPVRAFAGGQTFNVKDYGAVGNGVADDSQAIQAAVDAAIKAGTGNTVYVPAGTYLLHTAISIENAKQFTFTGASSTTTKFLTAPTNGCVVVVNGCTDTVIGNVSSDGQVLNFTQGTITSSTTSPITITVKLDAGYPDLNAPQLSKPTLFTFSVPTRKAYDGDRPKILGKSSAAPGVWTLTLNELQNQPFVGEKVVVWNRDDNPPGIQYNCGYDHNLTLKNINDYCGGWNSSGSIYAYTGSNSITNFYEGPPPGSNRLITSGGGVVGGGRGSLTITGCNLSQIDDDCFDLGGGFHHIVSQQAPNIITVATTDCQVGDSIQVWDWADGSPSLRTTATVVSVSVASTPNGRFDILTLSEPVTVLKPDPDNARGGEDGYDRINDVSASGSITFENCSLQSDRARGLLLHPDGDLMIHNCKISGCRWLGVYIGIEQETDEGAAPSKISVLNSQFNGNDGISCFIGIDDGYSLGKEKSIFFPSVLVSGNSFQDDDVPNSTTGTNPEQFDWPCPLVISCANAPIIDHNSFTNNWGPNVLVQDDINPTVSNNTFIRPNEIQGWPESGLATNTVIAADLVQGLTLNGNLVGQKGPFTKTLLNTTSTVTGVLGGINGVIDTDNPLVLSLSYDGLVMNQSINGSVLDQAKPSGAKNQIWTLSPLVSSPGLFTLQNAGSGLVVGNGSSQRPGTGIGLERRLGTGDSATPSQLWSFELDGSNGSNIINSYSGMAIHVKGGSLSPGARFMQWTPESELCQDFTAITPIAVGSVPN